MSEARAAIDIGSNSLLLTVVDARGEVLCDEVRVVGLGRGLGDGGEMRPDRLAAAEEVLGEYVALASRLGVPPEQIRAVATSAARRATNAVAFFERLQRAIGLRVRIVSGEEEARLTWLGAAQHLELPAAAGPTDRLVVDLGGGSTELVLGDEAHIAQRVSLEIGSVRLTEAHLCDRAGEIPDRFGAAGLADLRRHVAREVATVDLAEPSVVIGVAGTVTTLAAMQLGLQAHDPAIVHGARLQRAEIAGLAETLAIAPAAERRRLAVVAPQRADYLLAGAVVLDEVLGAAGASEMVISDRGLRFALLDTSTEP